jgi:hypothetical protein
MGLPIFNVKTGELASVATPTQGTPPEAPYITEELDDEQRKDLAKLIVDNTPFNEALREAVAFWPLAWLNKIVNEAAFRSYCLKDALDQSDPELLEEAKRYAGPDAVKKVLEPDMGFGGV